ncbi:helix-turn-helix transcriptional regulator [Myxococcus sp. CA040A]|uniref:helix-turn-helix domain-containing protein n=1 Tax=Myxococcus sp. CA040A TaxID=2741738 RepID=UPI00157A89F4|nr:helix-turn-helix transcriptional regulator [Myxococcus sp. CA040A]NTX07020.1 helix-turn-helix transcriptional regulator [Myxococcus sp. CA040A]
MPPAGKGHAAELRAARARAERERHGQVFRACRVELGLSLRDVATGWGVNATVLGELERGKRRFPAPADLFAALQQLFTWACERHGYGRLGDLRWRDRP